MRHREIDLAELAPGTIALKGKYLVPEDIDKNALKQIVSAAVSPAFSNAPIRLTSMVAALCSRFCIMAEREDFVKPSAIGDLLPAALSPEVQKRLKHDEQGESELFQHSQKLRQQYPEGKTYDLGAQGIPMVRQAWIEHFDRINHLKFTPEEVIYSSGGSPALGTVMEVFKNECTRNHLQPRLLYPGPSFATVISIAKEKELPLHPLPTSPTQHYTLHPDQLVEYFQSAPPQTGHLLYLTTLNNPTSLFLHPKELTRILDVTLTHDPQALFLIDCVYNATAPASQIHALMQVFNQPEVLQHCIFLESLSKFAARTGTRSAALFCHNEQWRQAILNNVRVISAGHPFDTQLFTTALLSQTKESDYQALGYERAQIREQVLKILLKRTDLFKAATAQTAALPHGLFWQGGIYAFPELQEGVDALQIFNETDYAVVPGKPFWGIEQPPSNNIRLSVGFIPARPR